VHNWRRNGKVALAPGTEDTILMSVPTYFSHSYRRDDQRLNQDFWKVFSGAGFSFFVDPRSDSTIHTHLERMMGRCSAFVAVVTRRRDVRRFYCSRFILYEYGLSIQARRPRLILRDHRVAPEPFERLTEDETHSFSPDKPLSRGRELTGKIKRLMDRAKTFPNRLDKARGPIALMLPPDEASCPYADPRVLDRIEQAADLAGFQLSIVRLPYEHNALFALDLDRYEAAVVDVRGLELEPWVFAYLYGRLIPTIKVARVMLDELPSSVALPPLVLGLRMDEREPGVESVTYWRDVDDLVWQLEQAFRKLDEEQTEFKEGRPGELYFESIGRRFARVFISNSSSANPLARLLSEELRLRNIEQFHYKEPNAIRTGSRWKDALRNEVRTCNVFVALIGPGYDESRWCREELRLALDRSQELMLLPYMVEKTNVRFMGELQVPELPINPAGAIQRVLADIHDGLTRPAPRDNAPHRRSTLLGASREAVIDAIRHVSREAWPGLNTRLGADRGALELSGTGRHPGRGRAAAERLFAEVQRAGARDADEPEPVRKLVATLAEFGPRRHREVLRAIRDRISEESDQTADD
jgi:hypothetical protein